ncbi:MAG: tetratricopeptide repeat protein, partial [bacterium]
LLLSGTEPAFVFIPPAFFLFPFMKTFENIVFILFVFLASVAGILLFSFEFPEKQDFSPQKMTSMINAVYNPLSEKDTSALSHSHLKDFVQGAEAFYEKRYEISVKHLSAASHKIKDNEFLASIENMNGAAFFMIGDYERAEEHFSRAFEISRSPLAGFNLMRLLNEKGDFKEAGMLDKQLDFSGVSTNTNFPVIYLPSLKKFFSFVFSDETSEGFSLRKSLIFTFLMISAVFSFIFLTVLRKINMRMCEECGSMMCIDCSVSYEGTICPACKIRKKASSLLIPEKERNLHKIKVRRFYSVKRIYTIFFALLFPGGGMIFGGKETGGIFYAVAGVFTAVPFLAENTGILNFCTPFAGASLFLILVIVAALLYIFSILSTVSLIQE